MTGPTPAPSPIIIGTAAWSIPSPVADRFPREGSGLARYAAVFPGTEINSTFYGRHRADTFVRWHDSVPAGFRFAVKLPRKISHEKRLIGADDDFAAFLDETAGLGEKRGPLLLQLPPSLALDPASAGAFLAAMRMRYGGYFVLEPRHASWFTPEAEALLVAFSVARVGADPPPLGGAIAPGGFDGLTYLRLHGTPKIYYSAYDDSRLAEVSALHATRPGPRWVIFDNTASGAAAPDALRFLDSISPTASAKARRMGTPF